MNREESIVALRPNIPSIKMMDNMTETERFQNEVLRPILKYQHDILVYYVLAKAKDRNSKFTYLITIEKERYLDRVTFKDNKIKQELIGMVTGMMTVEEMKTYLSMESECKRRIYTMTRERVVSTL